MDLVLKRTHFTDQSTIGTLYKVDPHTGHEEPLCKILEDTDRKLETTPGRKIYGKTAIPRGKYEIIRNMSQRFARPLPLLVAIPGYSGVRIHPGNTPADTDGCLLPGITESQDFVGSSRMAFDMVDAIIAEALKTESVWITIT